MGGKLANMGGSGLQFESSSIWFGDVLKGMSGVFTAPPGSGEGPGAEDELRVLGERDPLAEESQSVSI